jgi:hypothetical protein
LGVFFESAENMKKILRLLPVAAVCAALASPVMAQDWASAGVNIGDISGWSSVAGPNSWGEVRFNDGKKQQSFTSVAVSPTTSAFASLTPWARGNVSVGEGGGSAYTSFSLRGEASGYGETVLPSGDFAGGQWSNSYTSKGMMGSASSTGNGQATIRMGMDSWANGSTQPPPPPSVGGGKG